MRTLDVDWQGEIIEVEVDYLTSNGYPGSLEEPPEEPCLNLGLTTPNLEMAVIERSMIQYTRGKVIVMADHSKFGLVAGMSVTPLKHINVLITNRKIPEDFQNDLDLVGVEVVIA